MPNRILRAGPYVVGQTRFAIEFANSAGDNARPVNRARGNWSNQLWGCRFTRTQEAIIDDSFGSESSFFYGESRIGALGETFNTTVTNILPDGSTANRTGPPSLSAVFSYQATASFDMTFSWFADGSVGDDTGIIVTLDTQSIYEVIPEQSTDPSQDSVTFTFPPSTLSTVGGLILGFGTNSDAYFNHNYRLTWS